MPHHAQTTRTGRIRTGRHPLRTLLATAATALFAVPFAGLASAQQDPAATPAANDGPLFTFRVAGLDGIRPHPKDMGAYRALRMLGMRLPELPAELGGRQPDQQEFAAWVKTAWETLAGGLSVSVVETDGGSGVAVTAVAQPLAGSDPAAIADRMIRLAEEEGFRSMEVDGGRSVGTPFGSAALTTPGDGTLRFSFGEAKAEWAEWQTADLPGDAQPILSMTLDLPRLSPVIENTALAMAPAEAFEQLAAMGLIGPEAYTLTLAGGVTEDAGHLVARFGNAGARRDMISGDARLDAAFLDLAPRDTTALQAGVFSMDYMLMSLGELEEETGFDPLAMADDWLGLSARETLLEPLGPRYMFYRSMRTGGGGVASAVLLVELRDRAAFLRGHAHLVEKLNQLSAEKARGYIRFQPVPAIGPDAYTLAFPGLPIPLEITWNMSPEGLVVAGTPAALRAALARLNEDGPGFVTRAAELGALPGEIDADTVAIQFMDTRHYAERGYAGAAFASATLSNLVRSPADPLRDAGPILPGYTELLDTLAPAGSLLKWDGDDLVYRARGDRSAIVAAAVMAGNVDMLAPLAIIPISAGAAQEWFRVGRRFGQAIPEAVEDAPKPEAVAANEE